MKVSIVPTEQKKYLLNLASVLYNEGIYQHATMLDKYFITIHYGANHYNTFIIDNGKFRPLNSDELSNKDSLVYIEITEPLTLTFSNEYSNE